MAIGPDDQARAHALLTYHDAVLREGKAKDKVGELLEAMRHVHERKAGVSSSTDGLVADFPQVRELMEARKAREEARRRCADMALKISLVTDTSQ